MRPSRMILVLTLGLGQAVAFASSYYLLGVMADPIAKALGMTSGPLFLALSAAFLISAFLSAPAGRWIDRHGGRAVLMASSLAFGATLTVLGLAPGPAIAVIAVLALGVGMGIGLYGAAFALLAAAWGRKARGPITAVSLVGAAGGALGWPLSALMLESLGWRATCLIWAASHVLLCLPAYYRILPRARARHPHRASAPVTWDSTLIRLAVLFAGAWFVATAMATHLPRLLQALGLDPVAAASTAGLMGAIAILTRTVDLFVLHKARPLLTARLATLCHPAGALIAVVFGAPAAFALALGQGIGNGLLSVASGVLPLTLYGRHRYGERQARMLVPARFLQAAAPAVYGLTLHHSSGLALALSSGICLVMFGMTLGLRPR